MPYYPIYVAAFRTHDGRIEVDWDRSRDAIHEKHLDDAAMVQLGELHSAWFTLIDVSVHPTHVRAWLLANPEAWSPKP